MDLSLPAAPVLSRNPFFVCLFICFILYNCEKSSLSSQSSQVRVRVCNLICVSTRTCIGDHISPVLASLHWLCGKIIRGYKISLLTYKATNGVTLRSVLIFRSSKCHINQLVPESTLSLFKSSLKMFLFGKVYVKGWLS